VERMQGVYSCSGYNPFMCLSCYNRDVYPQRGKPYDRPPPNASKSTTGDKIMSLKKMSAEAAAVILSLVVLIAGVGAAFGITQHQLGKQEERLEDMESQYRKDHDILLEIKRDVHWIRSQVESTP